VAEPVSYGGQAVIEGVMMRGARFFAVACRLPNGEILVRQEAVPAFFTRYAWAKWPLLRGVFALADALMLGMKSLLFSANLAMEQEQRLAQPDATAPTDAAPQPDPITQALLGPLLPLLGASGGGGAIGGIAITGAAVSGMLIGIALFMLLPSLVAGWFTPLVGHNAWLSVIEGIVRVCLVLGYIAVVGQRKEVQRVFQYHGAEHQAINALETEGRVDVDAASRASRIHPRCGTNFILTVLLVKALIFTLIPWQSAWLPRLGLRLLLLLPVAALSYELIRLAGKYRHVALFQWLVLPGLLTQRLTTRPPGREMVEVAVASLRAVMEKEGTLPQSSPAEPVPAIA
jgi:uncharacterized protein YqhQ